MLKEHLRSLNQQISVINEQILNFERAGTAAKASEVSALRKSRMALSREAERLEMAHPDLKDVLFREELEKLAAASLA
jgi:uncharacterized protein YdcH (DUF465 family)